MSDPFEQIGAKLTAAREAAGLDIQQAAAQADVPLAAARALEAEDFSHFASPVYAKSFLLKYSGFLKVDARTWLDALAPGSFMASGSLLKGPEAPTQKSEEPETQRGGVIAVFILVLLSAAIIVAAIKGYEFFEARFSEPQQAVPDVEGPPSGGGQ